MMRRSVKTGSRAARHGGKTSSRLAEIPAATFITLAHRLPMLFAAAVEPKARANPELKRMVAEKAKAGEQSAKAAGKGAATAASMITRYWQTQARLATAMTSGLMGGNPAKAVNQMMRQGRMSANASAALGANLAQIAGGTAARALSPAHKKVTANAKRLSMKKTTGVKRTTRKGPAKKV